MIKSKKIISVVSVLAMVFSMFSAFTVVQAAGAEFKAEVSADSTFTADGTVKITYSYEGLEEANQKVGTLMLYQPIDSEYFEYVNSTKSTAYSGATIGYNEGTGQFVVSFSKMDDDRVSGTANEVATLELKVVKALPTNYQFAKLSKVGITAMADDYSEYDYTSIAVPEVVLNKYGNPTKFTAKVEGDSFEADSTIKITYSYEGLEEANQKVGTLMLYQPIDSEYFEYVNSTKSTAYSGATIGYNEGTGQFVVSFSKMDDDRVSGTANEVATLELKVVKALPTNYQFAKLSKVGITAMADDYSEYDYADIGIPTIVLNSTASSDPTPTPSAPAESPTPTPLPEEDYSVELDVKKDSTVAAGSKVEVTPKLVTGKTYEGKMDIVVQVYNGTANAEYAIGFVVFNDVAIDETVTFYAPAKAKISVNATDNISETSDNLLGTMVAKKVSK